MNARKPTKSPSDGRHRNLQRSMQKAPDDWVTGGQRMTPAQARHLQLLCEHAGVAFEARLTKAEASKRIDALRRREVFHRRAS